MVSLDLFILRRDLFILSWDLFILRRNIFMWKWRQAKRAKRASFASAKALQPVLGFSSVTSPKSARGLKPATRLLFGYFTQISSRAQTSDQASFRLLHPHQFAGSNRLLHPHQRPGSHQPCGSCFKPTSTPQWLLNLNGYKSSIVVKG